MVRVNFTMRAHTVTKTDTLKLAIVNILVFLKKRGGCSIGVLGAHRSQTATSGAGRRRATLRAQGRRRRAGLPNPVHLLDIMHALSRIPDTDLSPLHFLVPWLSYEAIKGTRGSNNLWTAASSLLLQPSASITNPSTQRVEYERTLLGRGLQSNCYELLMDTPVSPYSEKVDRISIERALIERTSTIKDLLLFGYALAAIISGADVRSEARREGNGHIN
ncbi:jg10192 [Pararge aegeria aegeria]|uniref:Jg10192 protein n=1 Tax=Pararge aegeria aegeria TaxID=348720 RepID=A0A8S4S555_9NEOP|nr:jg10192 [Pararge aegeria aegeria]